MASSPHLTRRFFLKLAAALGARAAVVGSPLPVSAQDMAGKRVPPLEAWYYTYPEWIEFWRYTPLDLKKIGLEVRSQSGTLTTVLGRSLRQKDYGDMVTFSWVSNAERVDPNFWLQLLHSAGGRNFISYKNPKLDELVDRQQAEVNADKRRQIVWDAQVLAGKDHPAMYLAHPDEINAYNKRDWADAQEGVGNGITFSNIWHYLSMRPLTPRKVFRSGFLGDIDTLNIFATSSGTNIAMLRHIYDTFVRHDLNLQVVPWAAESWQFVDPRTVDITMRQGMTFHDGKPVTMADVKFSFDYIKKWNFPLMKFAINYDTTEIRGDRVLRVKLPRPYAAFPTVDLTFLPILPRHVWEKIPERVGLTDPTKWEVVPELIGSGPFRFKSWRKGEDVVLEAHKAHWKAPKSDGYVARPVPTNEALIGMLENGEIDMTSSASFPVEAVTRLKQLPQMDVLQSRSFKLWYLAVDHRKKPFDDPRFREAFDHAIDRGKFVNIALRSAGVACKNTPVSPILKPWHNPNSPAAEFSIEKARDLLAKAGYSWDSQGYLVFPKA
ncbi:MAG: ABC transporter substrate-binding protein [Candidatus Rokuibacteriota bacterium]